MHGSIFSRTTGSVNEECSFEQFYCPPTPPPPHHIPPLPPQANKAVLCCVVTARMAQTVCLYGLSLCSNIPMLTTSVEMLGRYTTGDVITICAILQVCRFTATQTTPGYIHSTDWLALYRTI